MNVGLWSWNPAESKEWHFGLQPDGRTIRHEYWTGAAWQVQILPTAPVALDPAAKLVARWVSANEWHIYTRAADGRLVQWNYDPAAKLVRVRVI